MVAQAADRAAEHLRRGGVLRRHADGRRRRKHSARSDAANAQMIMEKLAAAATAPPAALAGDTSLRDAVNSLLRRNRRLSGRLSPALGKGSRAMKVIFNVDGEGQGKKGEMKEVSGGYARNYLLPRKLASEATADALNAIKLKEKAKAAQMAKEKALAEENAKRLSGVVVHPGQGRTGGRPLRRRHQPGDIRRSAPSTG